MNLSLPEIYHANMELMHQSIPAAPSPPRATVGHLPAFSVPGMGRICKFRTSRWPGIYQPRGYFQAFSRYARSFLSAYTEDITEKKADQLICQGQGVVID